MHNYGLTTEEILDRNSLRLVYTCPTDNKEYVVKFNLVEILKTFEPCDICGSHGEITMSVKCPCGDTHDIKVEGW